jgi:hypothetical protein
MENALKLLDGDSIEIHQKNNVLQFNHFLYLLVTNGYIIVF